MTNGCQLCGFHSPQASSPPTNTDDVSAGANGAPPKPGASETTVSEVVLSQQSEKIRRTALGPLPQPAGKHFRTTNVSAENAGGGYCPSYAWGCSRVHRAATDAAETKAIRSAVQEVTSANSVLTRQLADVRANADDRIGALKDHLAHTEAQLAAEKERSLSFHRALQTAKESLKQDRETRQAAVNRATAALTRLDHEEAHWREINALNRSLERELGAARKRSEGLEGVEKEKALLEGKLIEEQRAKERAEGAVQGLEKEEARLAAEVKRLRGVETRLRGMEESRDALQDALSDARSSLNKERKAGHVAAEQASTLQSETEELRSGLNRTKALLENEKQRAQELEQRLETVLRKQAQHEQESRVFKQDLKGASGRTAQAEARVAQLTLFVEEKEKEAQRAESIKTEVVERAQRNEMENAKSLGECRKEVTSLGALLTSAEEELRALDGECEELATQRTAWEEKAGNLQGELSTSKLLLEELAAKLRFESKSRKCAEEENQRLRLQKEQLERGVSEATKEAEDTERKLGEGRNAILAVRAELDGARKAAEWAERRADEAKRAADAAAERATGEHRTAEKLATEVENWKAKCEALDAEIGGHVAAREQQLEMAVRRELAASEDWEEREKRLLAKLDGKERDLTEAWEKCQLDVTERATCRAELDRCAEKVRVLEAQARDARDTEARAMRAQEEAEASAAKAAAEAAVAAWKAATLKKENAAMMANYDAWLKTLVKSSRVARPHRTQSQASQEPYTLLRPVRTDHDRQHVAHFSSPERDPPKRNYFAGRRSFDPSKGSAGQRKLYAIDDSSDSGDE